MSVIGCILIALIAQRWKSALIAALVVGLLGSAAFGFLHWDDTHYGSAPTIGFMASYIAVGTAAFFAETAAFFAIKRGINVLRMRRLAGKTSQPREDASTSSPQKLNAIAAKPDKLIFKGGKEFFEYQCKFGHTSIQPNHAVVGIIIDAQKELGTPTPVSLSEDGTQTVALFVASDDGGFLALSKTPSGQGDRLVPGDVVLWIPTSYSDEIGHKMSDRRSGWIGLVRAKLNPEVAVSNPGFSIACRYD
jgi:hypothetical protein